VKFLFSLRLFLRHGVFSLTVLILAAFLPVLAAAPRSADQWYAAGQQAMRASKFDTAAQAFAEAAKLNPSAANWRWLGEAYQRQGNTDAASAAFDQAISKYRRLGDAATANALDHRAAPLRQTLELRLLGQPTSPDARPDAACSPPLARLEPKSGLLLGTYVNTFNLSRPGQGLPRLLLPEPGAAFAVYFRYFNLVRPGQGEVFPTRFVQAVRAAGGAVHLAAEPKVPLSQVTESFMLPFAQAARASGVPIYLRFASEMNDSTNAWSRDPAAYRAAFVRVARVMHRVAPNVAMVWMPMASRLENIAAYYPGKESVDWAGLSLYSVPFENGQLSRPNTALHPTDLIESFYRRYACTHPIQLSEYAAAHRSQAAPGQDFTAFAVQQMRETYWGALLHFPRLKNINWLDLDMTAERGVRKTGGRLNDYRLYAAPAKLEVLRGLLSEGYFQARLNRAAPSALGAQAWPSVLEVAGDLQGAVWAKTATPVVRVAVALDDQAIPAEATLPYRFTLPLEALGSGTHTLAVTIQTTSTGTLSRTQTFQVR
jgi:hypothetical protein